MTDKADETTIRILYVGRHHVGEELRLLIESVLTRPGTFLHLNSVQYLLEGLNGDATDKLLVLVDYFALWGTGPDFVNYTAFMQQYARSRAKQQHRALLMVVRSLSDGPLGNMIGWGTLVDAYCSLPLSEEKGRYLFSRLEAALWEEGKHSLESSVCL